MTNHAQLTAHRAPVTHSLNVGRRADFPARGKKAYWAQPQPNHCAVSERAKREDKERNQREDFHGAFNAPPLDRGRSAGQAGGGGRDGGGDLPRVLVLGHRVES